jgi:hypothetical protein
VERLKAMGNEGSSSFSMATLLTTARNLRRGTLGTVSLAVNTKQSKGQISLEDGDGVC